MHRAIGHEVAREVRGVRVDDDKDEEGIRYAESTAESGERRVGNEAAVEGAARQPHALGEVGRVRVLLAEVQVLLLALCILLQQPEDYASRCNRCQDPEPELDGEWVEEVGKRSPADLWVADRVIRKRRAARGI